jgi:hypothetical protein
MHMYSSSTLPCPPTCGGECTVIAVVAVGHVDILHVAFDLQCQFCSQPGMSVGEGIDGITIIDPL